MTTIFSLIISLKGGRSILSTNFGNRLPICPSNLSIYVILSSLDCEKFTLYWSIKAWGLGLMLANLGTSVKVMSLRQLVPSNPICDPSTMLTVTIVLLERAPKPPLVIKSNSLTSFMLVGNPVTFTSMLSHMLWSTAQHRCLLVFVYNIDLFLSYGPIGCHIYEDKIKCTS